jgi:hypothetical protein
MRSKTIFGALLVSVALCSQGFGFELLDRMLGLNSGGCGECKACANVACCAPAKACCPEPACAKPACCQPACEVPCRQPKCHKLYRRPVVELFGNMKELFEAKGCYCEKPACCEAPKCCPEPACAKPCHERVRRCHKVRCETACAVPVCEKACAQPACCQPACETPCRQPKCHKLYRRPVVELLENLFACHRCCSETTCGCGCGCNGGAPAAAPAPVKAPVKAPEAPLPQAPKADPSASIDSRGIYEAAPSLVRN